MAETEKGVLNFAPGPAKIPEEVSNNFLLYSHIFVSHCKLCADVLIVERCCFGRFVRYICYLSRKLLKAHFSCSTNESIV